MQPFDQAKWAATYGGVSASQALEAFSALRGWNLRLIVAALPAAAGRTTTHPERGAMTFQTIVETMAGHDLNHLGQLRRLARMSRRSSRVSDSGTTALLVLLAGRGLGELGCGLFRLIAMMVPVMVRHSLRDFFIGKLGWAAKMQDIFFDWGAGLVCIHWFLLFQDTAL